MDKLELSNLLKAIRKFEKESVDDNQGLRIAIIGSTALQYFVKFLKYALHLEGINCSIFEGEYDSIRFEVFEDNSQLYAFKPNIVILLPFFTDLKQYPTLLASEDEIESLSNQVISYYKSVWNNISKIDKVNILQANFVLPPIKELGNLEFQIESSKGSFIRELNQKLNQEKPSNVIIVDADALSNNIGKYNWFNYSAYYLNKAPVSLEYMPEFVDLFVQEIKALNGNTKKCLVLDLDNTLWGGVVGDVGFDGIQIDPNNAVGEAFRAFQSYCLNLKRRGVILAVCSKNELEIAKEPFLKNENMILKLDDISCFVANWENKAENLKAISQQLNIGTDSFVFFDDNPAEREIVKQYLPEVRVIEVPNDPALYVLQMEKEHPFEWLQITKEDLVRSQSYLENKERMAMQEKFVNYTEYLQALDMKGGVYQTTDSEVSRFAQLINKSNQFNLRTIRYTEADIQNFITDKNTVCLYAKLSDSFSNYGIISCVILKFKDDTCFIDTWVMSCRVLKRTVENMMFAKILAIAKEHNCSRVLAEYLQTKKNKMVENYYDSLGFELESSNKVNEALVKEYSLSNLSITPEFFITEE